MLGRLTAGVGVGIGAGVAGAGWFYSSVLLDTRQRPAFPERVLAAGAGSVTLARSRLTVQPGTWGLRWSGGLAVVGPVTHTDDAAVVRPLLDGPLPAPRTAALLDAWPYEPDPAARGLAFDEVAVPTPLGPAPAWLVPADGADWVIAVHGRGATRAECLRVLPALHRGGHPVLAISYRNDPDAPASPDGRYHLGNTEWADLQAAVRWARGHGARRVVLFGWSMGGAIVAAFLDRSPDAAVVAAVVWDAPLLDWRATLRQQARNRRLPAVVADVAAAITSRRIGIDFDRFDLLRRPPAVRPPTLVVHSSEDTVVPVGASRALGAAAAAMDWPLRYVEVPGVEHTAAWNGDPAGYERTVTGFLAQVLHPERGPAGAGTMGP